MNKFLRTTAVLSIATFGAPVFAGNLEDPIITPAPAPMPAPAPVSMGGDWSGFYAGGSLGYADVSEDADAFDDGGVTYGVHAGYDYDFGDFIMGGELELSGFDVSDGGVDVDSVARAKLRAGYDAGAIMPYLTIGYAQLETGGALAGSDTGPVYGLGMDYALSDQLRVGGEVLKHEFNNFDDTGLDLDATTASVRMSFSF